MNEFFQAMHAQEKASTSHQWDHRPEGNDDSSSGSVQAKLVRLEFPRYDRGEDPTIWLCRVEQYFKFQGMEETEKVCLASYHLEGDARVWVQRKKSLRPQMDWEEFKINLMLKLEQTHIMTGLESSASYDSWLQWGIIRVNLRNCLGQLAYWPISKKWLASSAIWGNLYELM